MKSVSYQTTEIELTPSSSEISRELEIEYESEYNSQDHETISPLSKEPVKVQNELSEAYKKIEKLETDVRRLSEPFVATAYLQTAEQDIPLVAQVDPVKKVIISIRVENTRI